MFNVDQEILPDSMNVLHTHMTSLTLGRAEWGLLQKIKSVFRDAACPLSTPEDLQAPHGVGHRGPGSTANTGVAAVPQCTEKQSSRLLTTED